MELLEQIIIEGAGGTMSRIQLLQGDLCAIPPEHAADILVISAYPGSYTPLPKTMMAALNDKGVNVAALAKNKATDLRQELGCWLSQPLTETQQAQLHFKQILCFEPRQSNTATANTTTGTSIAVNTETQWWNMLAVKQQTDKSASILFRFSSGSAADGGEGELLSNTAVIQTLLQKRSTSSNWDKTIAATLFQLMLPAGCKLQLKSSGCTSWLVDKKTAAYPWELLQENFGSQPFCISAGLIRQLNTGRGNRPATGIRDAALVIADPLLNGFAAQLPAAGKEAMQVVTRLKEKGLSVNVFIQQDAASIIEGLFSSNYKIIHLDGYGRYEESIPEQTGLLIAKDVLLTVAEIKQLSELPDLVFINCSYTSAEDLSPEYGENRQAFAAAMGTQLIEAGVKAVVVAGWAVNTNAAIDFTDEFYANMLKGSVLWKAVQQARKMVYDKYENDCTWGAYQCYGDPFFTLIHQPLLQEIVVGNIFRCINTFAFNNQHNVIAMPVLASGNQGVPIEKMLPALLDAAIFWLEKGLPLQCIKLVLYSEQQAKTGLPVFKRAKEKNELKQSARSGAITAIAAVEQLQAIKSKQFAGEGAMQIVEFEIKNLAEKEQAQNELMPQIVKSLVPGQAGLTGNIGSVSLVAGDGYDYFISYAHTHAAIVDAFVQQLKQNNNKLAIFYDKQEIEPGGLWIKNISDAIEQSKKVLVFLSPDYSNSKVCWTEFQCAQLMEFNGKENVIVTIYLYSMKIPLIMGIHSFINCREADKAALQETAVKLSAL